MKRTLLLLAVAGLIFAPGALAQGKGRGHDHADWVGGPLAQGDNPQGWGNQFSPGEARESVREGKTVPLSKIFQSLKREYGGYQLNANLYAGADGGAYYEIDWMSDSGRKMRFIVDAVTGAILERQGA